MSQVARWFDRKFEFTFPTELYPDLCIRLRGTPARMQELLQDVPTALLARKPYGKWSIQEHAGHLLDLEDLWRTRAEQYTTGARELAATDLNNTQTDQANYNGRSISGILAGFRKARFDLVNRLAEFDPGVFGQTALHPRLKTPMRLVDHLYFVAEHDDHHLAQMWSMLVN